MIQNHRAVDSEAVNVLGGFTLDWLSNRLFAPNAAVALILFTNSTQAQIPTPAHVPQALPPAVRLPLAEKSARLEERRAAILASATSHNEQCRSVPAGTPEASHCAASRDRLLFVIREINGHLGEFRKSIEVAVAAETARLTSRDNELAAAIERDIVAIRRLGFERSSRDFAQWEQLGGDAQAQFESEVLAAAADVVAGRITDRLLESFSRFGPREAGRWIRALENADVDPKPTELIRVIRKVGNTRDKSQIADDAAAIIVGIERVQQAMAARTREDWLLWKLDLMCDLVSPSHNKACHTFKTISTLTLASVYNNVTRRVAIHEVERLTSMTEDQLRSLRRINDLMIRHTREQRDVRALIRDLN